MKEIAYVLIDPYTIRKSRLGGVIARYLSRTDLKLVAARMFGASQGLVEDYARAVVERTDSTPHIDRLLDAYIRKEFAPKKETGRPHRSLCLLFEGEDAIRKIWECTGSVTLRWGGGQTVRETFGDYIAEDDGTVSYFEPAVLVAPTRSFAIKTLKILLDHIEDSGIVNSHFGEPGVERTLVMLKPDNFQRPSLRAGNIIDLLSSAGLHIVCVKKFAMTVAQAEQFYGPVVESVKKTGRIVIVGDACERNSVMRDMASTITELAFDYLDAPPVVVGSRNWITPCFELDDKFFPQASTIIDAISEKILPLAGRVPKANFTTLEKIDRCKKGV